MSAVGAIVFWPRHVGLLPTAVPRASHVMYAARASTSFDVGAGPLARSPLCAVSCSRRAGRVLAAQETVDDAIGEAVEAARSPVVLGEHPGDADQRQRPLPLAAVQMAVVAGHPARRESRRLGRRVGEELEAPPDVRRQLRVVQGLVGQRVLREIPRRHHRRAGRDERARQGDAGRRGRDGRAGARGHADQADQQRNRQERDRAGAWPIASLARFSRQSAVGSRQSKIDPGNQGLTMLRLARPTMNKPHKERGHHV